MNKIILATLAFFLSYFAAQAQRSSCKALVDASKTNNKNLVKEQLKTVSANCIYPYGEPRTPLVAASRKGALDIVKLLINAKAKINFHAKGDETPLIAAAANNHLSLVKYLLKNGARINTNLSSDGTALIAAVRNNNYQIAKFLLENGANPMVDSHGDEYPMYHARRNKNKAMIKLIRTYENKHSQN